MKFPREGKSIIVGLEFFGRCLYSCSLPRVGVDHLCVVFLVHELRHRLHHAYCGLEGMMCTLRSHDRDLFRRMRTTAGSSGVWQSEKYWYFPNNDREKYVLIDRDAMTPSFFSAPSGQENYAEE